MATGTSLKHVDIKLCVAVGAGGVLLGLGSYYGLKYYKQEKLRRSLTKAYERNGTEFYQVPGTRVAVPLQFIMTLKDGIENFEIRPDDVFVITFPKCGTTWTQEIVWLVCNNADTEKAKSKELVDRFPMIPPMKGCPGLDKISKKPPPRFLKTHLALDLLPKQLMEKQPKIIYTTRNPKDALVSFYHHMSLMKEHCASLFETMDWATNKSVGWGSFWDHNREFWNLSKCNDNILFLKYEDMIKDQPAAIRTIAKFLNKSLTEEQIGKIAEHCSFKSMKKNAMVNYTWMRGRGMWSKSGDFMRKGKVGDWKNHLTIEMSERIDELTKEHLEPLGLSFQEEL